MGRLRSDGGLLLVTTPKKPSPKGADRRAPLFCSVFRFLGHFLGHYLRKTPHRTLCKGFQRRERDSNSRYPFGVHTLSRRASSATRASLQYVVRDLSAKPDCKDRFFFGNIRKFHGYFQKSYSFTRTMLFRTVREEELPSCAEVFQYSKRKFLFAYSDSRAVAVHLSVASS